MTAKPFVIASYITLGGVWLFVWSSMQDLNDSLHKRLGEQQQVIIEKDGRIKDLEEKICRDPHFGCGCHGVGPTPCAGGR